MSSITGPRESALRPLSGVFQQDASVGKAIPKASSAAEANVHYTCFVRLPFPRAGFVDPPQVEWNSTKDRALWKIISKASNSKELDWEDLSAKFDVSLSFLLQQAAWLYERHFAQMKAQMKKLSPSTAPSPTPPDTTSSSTTPAMSNFPPGSIGPRAPSGLSTRPRDSPTPTIGSGHFGTIRTSGTSTPLIHGLPFATYASSGITRTASTRTLTQSYAQGIPPSPVQPSRGSFRNSLTGQRKAPPQAPQENVADDSPPPAELSDSDSSSEEEASSQSLARSQAFRRPASFGTRRGTGAYDADDDDDDGTSSGGFLPFAAASVYKPNDPAATLRSPPPKRISTRVHAAQASTVAESSTSSASSAAADPEKNQRRTTQHTDPASAISPRQQANLRGLSPQLRRDGSEGTPSMGSSFSDLDDASISQSALEDAYLSNMQRGASASRMSTISQAIRSRYL